MKTFVRHMAVLITAALFYSSGFAQDWVSMMNDPHTNFFDVQKAFNSYYEQKKSELTTRNHQTPTTAQIANEIPGFTIYKNWEWMMAQRVSPTGERFKP